MSTDKQGGRSLIRGIFLDESNNVGALINESHLNKVLGMVERAAKEVLRCTVRSLHLEFKGAKVLRGGKRLQPKDVEDGFYFDPTVLTNVNDGMEIVRDEIFGPVMMLLPFDTEDEVIKRANNTTYGWSSSACAMQELFRSGCRTLF